MNEIVIVNHASSEDIGDEHHQDQQWQNLSILLDVDDSGEAGSRGKVQCWSLTRQWVVGRLIMFVSMGFLRC